MSFDLVPAELLAAALSAVLMSVAVAFPLAAGIIAGPRRSWSGAGLAMGTGLLAGVVLTAAAAIAGLETLQTLATIGLVLGLACAIGAAVLVILVEDGNTLATTVGVIACVLIGIGQPGRTLPAMQELSSSILVVIASVVIGAVALVAITGFLVAAAGRVRALQLGVAVAAILAAVLIAIGMLLPEPPVLGTLITVLIVLALGSVGGGVLETMKARQQPAVAPEEI